jgi:hypothetical protein
MSRKLKNIISLWLLLILFTPTFVKLEHHHEHVIWHPAKEKQFHIFYEKCAICCFEFSIFFSEKSGIASAKSELTDNYNSFYKALHHSDPSRYSFLLRAPPVFTNDLAS